MGEEECWQCSGQQLAEFRPVLVNQGRGKLKREESKLEARNEHTFDYVFPPEANTEDVYSSMASSLVRNSLLGFNCTIFAYGQTGSGKTHTLMGRPEDPGIIIQATHDVFHMLTGDHNADALVHMSYVEIYNEQVLDLLDCQTTKDMSIYDHPTRGAFIKNVAEEVVTSPEEVMALLELGEKGRHYGATKMNATSSRSHTLMKLVIETKKSNESAEAVMAELFLVDLAGSERVAKARLQGGATVLRGRGSSRGR